VEAPLERIFDPVHEILDRIEILTNLVYLTKHEAGNEEKVLVYMSIADIRWRSSIFRVKRSGYYSRSL
jgi:hypothetical protein